MRGCYRRLTSAQHSQLQSGQGRAAGKRPLRAPKHTHACRLPAQFGNQCCRSPCKHKQCRAGWLPPGHSSARAAAAAASAATWVSPLLPQRLAAARSSRQPRRLL